MCAHACVCMCLHACIEYSVCVCVCVHIVCMRAWCVHACVCVCVFVCGVATSDVLLHYYNNIMQVLLTVQYGLKLIQGTSHQTKS